MALPFAFLVLAFYVSWLLPNLACYPFYSICFGKILFLDIVAGNKNSNLKGTVSNVSWGGCEGVCDFAFLQEHLKLQNDGKIEDFYEMDQEVGSGISI